MPITNHPSFLRPAITTKLWRYIDLPKFISLLAEANIWLTNAEILAADDPYEGTPNAMQFPHRIWSSIEDVPDMLKKQILAMNRGHQTDESSFENWVMSEEQRCFMELSNRRNFYVNCWHAANHESVAMWKIYGAPGHGIAIVSNGGRIEAALEQAPEDFHLGSVKYVETGHVQIGTANAYDSIMIKRENYSYEQEVRLVHWETESYHDALENFSWNKKTMRFEDIVDDNRPLKPGLPVGCNLDKLIESVVISPFAPHWYVDAVQKVSQSLGYNFRVSASKLLEAPTAIS